MTLADPFAGFVELLFLFVGQQRADFVHGLLAQVQNRVVAFHQLLVQLADFLLVVRLVGGLHFVAQFDHVGVVLLFGSELVALFAELGLQGIQLRFLLGSQREFILELRPNQRHVEARPAGTSGTLCWMVFFSLTCALCCGGYVSAGASKKASLG